MSTRSQQRSKRVSWYQVGAGTAALALGTVACMWVGNVFPPEVSAQAPAPAALPAGALAPTLPPDPNPPPAPPVSSDYASRVVAYLHGNVPITREQLGEFLIARYGAEKLEHLVNKLIIEEACKARGITVTNTEIEADLANTVKGLGVNQSEFVSKVLKGYHKTLYEWKEDVIRPKLLMTKYCQGHVVCTPDDLQKAFDAYYGEKLECRMIVWPKEEYKQVMMDYARLRDSEEYFTQKAKQQASPTLAANGGKIKPFGRNCFGNDQVEREIFNLHPGELTSVIETPEGVVVLKLDRRIPADTTVNFNAVREKLTQEVLEKKIQAEIPRTFAQLRKQAEPTFILKDPTKREDLKASVERVMSAANSVLTTPQGPRPAGR